MDLLNFENSKKHLCESVHFSLPLQSCSPDFLISANADPKKNVSFENSEVVGSFPEQGL